MSPRVSSQYWCWDVSYSWSGLLYESGTPSCIFSTLDMAIIAEDSSLTNPTWSSKVLWPQTPEWPAQTGMGGRTLSRSRKWGHVSSETKGVTSHGTSVLGEKEDVRVVPLTFIPLTTLRGPLLTEQEENTALPTAPEASWGGLEQLPGSCCNCEGGWKKALARL